MGGLGNQLFQYAAGRSLAVRLDAELSLDISWFRMYNKRAFHLPFFNIEPRIATRREIRCFMDRPGFTGRLHKWFRLFVATEAKLSAYGFRRWKKEVSISQGLYYKEPHFHYDSTFDSLSGDVYLDGYWQSEKYFKAIEGLIRNQFTLRAPPDKENSELAERITSCESVALHIRRGDYVTNPDLHLFHGLCDIRYYIHAVNYLLSQLQSPQFFVFTDDPEWAKRNLDLLSPFVIVEHNGALRDYEDLRLLSLCKHNIIANSTFSWWGAWLNANGSKIVLAPEKWFHVEMNESDLIPEGWRRIRNTSSTGQIPSL
jgi:hypothetical protein